MQENVGIELIEDAARRLDGLAVRTPLLESPQINETLGLRVLFKAECLQRTGSFKFRGAYTKLSRLSAEVRQNGVVAYSSGNHAQGVSAAAQILGIHATNIMPSDAPRIKIDNTRGYGADVIHYERPSQDRRAIAEEFSRQTGAIIVPPFNDVDVISGQGTTGLEIDEQLRALGIVADAVFCPVGGGGLLSGLATAIKARRPQLEVWCAEPAGYDDVTRSIISGQRETADTDVRTICDAIVTPQPGVITFEIIRKLVQGGLVVSDAEVKNTIALLFDRLKLVVEPGGSVAFAALLKNRARWSGKTVVVVLSGGNVDRADFASYLGEATTDVSMSASG